MTNKGREVLLQMLRDRVPAMGAALARARNDAVGMVDHLGLEGVDAEAKERSLILEDMGRYFAILPVSAGYTTEEYCHLRQARPVAPGFAYNSGSNPEFLTVEQLQELIARHVFSGEAVD